MKPLAFVKARVTGPSGQKVDVILESYGRPGMGAPRTIYIRFGGRLITPYEQYVRDWSINALDLMALVYKEAGYNYIAELVYQDNPLLALIPKGTAGNNNKGGTYVKIPVNYGS